MHLGEDGRWRKWLIRDCRACKKEAPATVRMIRLVVGAHVDKARSLEQVDIAIGVVFESAVNAAGARIG